MHLTLVGLWPIGTFQHLLHGCGTLALAALNGVELWSIGTLATLNAVGLWPIGILAAFERCRVVAH